MNGIVEHPSFLKYNNYGLKKLYTHKTSFKPLRMNISGRKKFYRIGPWAGHWPKLPYVQLRIFWGQCYKTDVINEYARAFVNGKPFQPSLMFAGKARSLP